MNKEVKTLRKPTLLILYITRVTVLLIFLSYIMFYKKSVHHIFLMIRAVAYFFSWREKYSFLNSTEESTANLCDQKRKNNKDMQAFYFWC